MALKNDKRGIFFTILVIVILSLFFISYFAYSNIKSDRKAVNKRIETMNNFIFSLEKDMSRQVYISGYRALLSLESHITKSGNYLENARESIKEALLNGTVNGSAINLMDGYTLYDWNSRVAEMAEGKNLIINYTILDVEVSQEDPWNVKITVLIDLLVRDKGDLAYWNKTQEISSKIEIIGFEDPVYLISTNGKVINKINKTSFFPFVSGIDVSNLTSHVVKSNYINSTMAPSFLLRLEGNYSYDANGIESLVYLPELADQGIELDDKSCVDHIYFSGSNPTSYKINDMPAWFEIDYSRLEFYGVSELI